MRAAVPRGSCRGELPRPAFGRHEALHEFFHVEQRPDQQTAVRPPREMLAEQGFHLATVEHVIDARLRAEQAAPHVVDRLAAIPARVRSGEALLEAVGDLGRDVALHELAQDELAVAGLREVARRLRTRLVLVEPYDLLEIAE